MAVSIKEGLAHRKSGVTLNTVNEQVYAISERRKVRMTTTIYFYGTPSAEKSDDLQQTQAILSTANRANSSPSIRDFNLPIVE